MKWVWIGLLAFFAGVGSVQAREDLLLQTGWKFLQSDVPDAQAVSFDDSAWESVRVPHCWNVQAGETGDTKHFDQGPGWYRLRITPDAATAGKSFFLKFDAAYHAAEVYLNGQSVGKHVGGFGAFCFDVTPLIHPGKENLLAVKVSFKAPFPSAPLGGDFTKFPGLYRNVHLLVLDPLSISPLDDASPGVYLKQVHVDQGSAQVQVTTKLRNGSTAARTATVRCRLLDAAGTEVQSIQAEQSVPAAGFADSVQEMHIDAPHLWNGRIDPYLYHVEVSVSDGANVVDRLVQPLGLRSFRVDPSAGFFLNGKPYALHGVNRHQQRFGKGWALSQEDFEQDMSIILEIGATCLRTCHYQHASEWHDLCDRSGLVVWSELAMVNGIPFESPEFVTNTHQQLAELIKQNYNHPSICFWGLWNEIDVPRKDLAKQSRCVAFIRTLQDQAHDLDPTRLTTGASCCAAFAPMSLTDVAAWNGYPGWYIANVDGWPELLQRVHSKIGDRPLGVSEYGAGASVLDHQIANDEPLPAGHFHPEEWQAFAHEENWKTIGHTPSVWGTFIWNIFDFASIERREGDADGVNDKGLVTGDRKTRKDAFYFYQAQWTTAPMVHINSRRFNPHPVGPVNVKVYSNCEQVELMLNGKSLGSRSAADRIFIWPDVNLPLGTNKLEARGTGPNGPAVTDEITWNCTPDASPHLGPVDPPAPEKKK